MAGQVDSGSVSFGFPLETLRVFTLEGFNSETAHLPSCKMCGAVWSRIGASEDSVGLGET